MNYKPFCGYWFYGAATANERAVFFATWGLRATAAVTAVSQAIFAVYYRFRRE
jgi:hypothetical protein